MTTRPVYGRAGAIACGHPAAAKAGWDMLAAGGSVADAAVAAGAVLSVVLPQACTIGGDAFILVHDAASATTFGLNASGRSPAATEPAAFADGIPERGPRSCAVPGVVGGWSALHRRFGRLPWSRVLARAIELAESGFPASPGLADATRSARSWLEQDPGARALFLEDETPVAGRPFRQPALGRTLATVAEGGAEAFYKGAIADALGAYVRSQGGWLAAPDLAAYAPEWVAPVATEFRGKVVRVMPPNSFGLFMLLQLAALDSIDLSRISGNSPDRYAALIAAAQAAFTAGDSYVCDPRMARGPTSDALSDESLAALRSAFRARLGSFPANRGGTAVVAVMDAAGNAAALVQSVFLGFGAAVADPTTGILLNDRMIGFNTEPNHPNVVAAAKQPAHTLNPAMVFEGGQVRQVLLTPGGPGQTLTLTQVLQGMCDHGLALHEAIAMPRWSMDLSGAVVVEPTLPPNTLAALQARGIEAGWGVAGSPFFGSVEAVERLADGGLAAVADDRREAHALAL